MPSIYSRRVATTVAAIFGCMLLVTSADSEAATITYLGQDTSTHADWRTATVDKPFPFDQNGDDIYGSDGYHMAIWSGSGSAILEREDLPSYIDSTDPLLAGTYAHGGYAPINDPAELVQPTNVAAGLWYQGGTNEQKLFDFTLAQDATFVLGIISNTHNVGDEYNLTAVGVEPAVVTNPDLIPINSTAREAFYEFFLVSGNAGEEFTVWGQGPGSAIVTGLTFESVPEPSGLALLMLGLPGLTIRRSRQRR